MFHLYSGALSEHCFLIFRKSAVLIGIGLNISGQLGVGDLENRYETSSGIVQNIAEDEIVNISCGRNFSLFLISKHSKRNVYVVGSNQYHELGITLDESTMSIEKGNLLTKPVQMPRSYYNDEMIEDVVACTYNSFLITTTGDVFGFGENKSGQLGTNNFKTHKKPVRIAIPEKMTKIGGGIEYSIFVSKTGKVYFCGKLRGLNDEKSVVTMTLISNQMKSQKITKFSCGAFHVAFLLGNNRIYCIGRSNQGQLGAKQSERKGIISELLHEKITQVKCGVDFTVFKTEKSEFFATGANNCGQLGLGNEVNAYLPTLQADVSAKVKNLAQFEVGAFQCYFISHDSKIYGCGSFYGNETRLKLLSTKELKKREMECISFSKRSLLQYRDINIRFK